MEKRQVWKDERHVLQKKGSDTEELFHDDKFQSIYYSLQPAETITITPEPEPVSVLLFVMEGKLLIHAKGYQEELMGNNSVLLTDIEKTYVLEAVSFSRVLGITSAEVQSVDQSEQYLEMLRKAERKDKGTFGHGRRVGRIAMRIAQEYDASYDLIALGKAATLHDIGKIHTPAEILLKPASLTKEEFEIIKRHPLDSYEILKEHYSPEVMIAALQHHERLDGSGYPYGLKGDDICMNARIIAIADVFDAMTSLRSYHDPVDDETAMAFLSSHPEAFDIRFVNILQKLMENGTIAHIRTLFAQEEVH